MSRFFVGHISDLPEGKETLASAIQQVERTERVLKSLWREKHQLEKDWLDRYRVLEVQSEQCAVRRWSFCRTSCCEAAGAARWIERDMSSLAYHKPLRAVNFICHAPQAKAVALVGDFNHWSAAASPMKQMPDR